MVAFQDSFQMATSNLMNLFITEEMRSCLPQLIINAAFSQMFKLPRIVKKPIFYLSLLNNIASKGTTLNGFNNFSNLLI